MTSNLRAQLVICILGLMAMATALSSVAAPITHNFDELGAPVDCCFGSGAYNVVSYPDLTVSSGPSAVVMNYQGWSNMQTSGINLYGTLDGYIDLTFSSLVNNLNFDIINGAGEFTFSVNYYDLLNNLIEVDLMSLNSFASAGSVGHIAGSAGNIAKVRILGNEDFAIDTISFEIAASEVPEPDSLALFALATLCWSGMLLARRRSQRYPRIAHRECRQAQ
ncbi:PEP-CTERM sorting domain-containing protein [Undibacterium sp. Ren11W]|uniref:PEP-CTERM sorting domain-containing protein n=1 Tax=Undibacterium sp. Ren11W TaxID=3413045 RepID=UPI003BEF5E69